VTAVIDLATRQPVAGSASILHAVTAEETALTPDVPALRRLPQKVLVQLATGGQGSPFFWVHGVGGEVFSYLQLSRHLAANRPVYGFTADWSQIAGERMPTLEEMAAAYVAEMRVVQPHGPYFIGGFCSAAMLALEVARQLEAQHQKVGLLAAIDYDLVPVETSPKGLRAIAAFLRNVPRWVREDAMASGPKELLGRLRSKLRGWRRASSDKTIDVRDQFGMWRFPDYQVAMLKAHHQAIHSYRPKSLNGHVALFLPRTAPLLGPWPKGHGAEWDHIARGGVEVHRVRGSHATLLREPFVEALGRCLNACIEEVERGPGGPPARASHQSATAAVATAMTAVIF
jgi:thioesterase domain-containing protein